MHLIGIPGGETNSGDHSPLLLGLAVFSNVVCVEGNHEEGDTRRCQLQQFIVATVPEFL